MFLQVLNRLLIRGCTAFSYFCVIALEQWFTVWKGGVGDCLGCPLCSLGFSESVFLFAVACEGCLLTVCTVLPSSWRCVMAL